MMEFITGLLAGACIFMGYLLYNKPKPTVNEIDERTKQKEKELSEHFDALMNYDVAVAYKKVKE